MARKPPTRFALPEIPEPLRSIAAWLGIFSWVVALAIFLASRIAPDFTVEYEDMGSVPIAAIEKGFGLVPHSFANDAQTKLLRISVRNARSSAGAQDVKIVVADYIQHLAFVVGDDGKAVQGYALTPSGNTSRLEVPIGYLSPRSDRVIFVGGKCLFLGFADIHAESSNLGTSDSSQAASLSGTRLFVGENAEWLAAVFFVALGAALFIGGTRKKL